jgi:serine protease Do
MFRQSRRRPLALAAMLLAGTALGGAGVALRPAAAQPAPTAIQAPALPAMPGFGDLVARVRPAVVTITSTTTEKAEPAASPFPSGSEQDRVFRRYFDQQAEGRPARAAKALGSGFVVDADGHIVTNNHVVANATAVMVTLDDGRELPATVVGHDARTDVALLKVDAGAKLPFLALGDSDRARPGDWVVAMGNPFGLGGTVTAGIVSARGRDIGSGPYDDFLQVDAPINRGNSGGPLFGTDGSVLGVNTAIFSPSGGSIGIGFAIPSNLVRQVVAQLQEHGKVERGFLGVSTQKVDAAMAAALNLPQAQGSSAAWGALVAEVEPSAPADAAGIRAGDVITAVGDHAVADPRALAREVAGLRPGSAATLTVQRDGTVRTMKVTAAAMQEQAAAGGEERQDNGASLGLALAPVGREARDSLGLAADAKGAVIAAVRPGSRAEAAGLRAGDLLIGVAGKPVASPEDATRAIRSAGQGKDAVRAPLALQVMRDGHSRFVAVESAKG